MNKKRPVNLDLRTLHFPVMAICSIFHRISGVVVFLLLPFMFYLLQASLQSFHSFHQLQACMQHAWMKFLVWGFASALFYHFLAGVRHMIGDLGYGERLQQARQSAKILLLLTIVGVIFLGVWIW
jgi:succinate dehydrogenase / fumarate reductase cytochrome b subunit